MAEYTSPLSPQMSMSKKWRLHQFIHTHTHMMEMCQLISHIICHSWMQLMTCNKSLGGAWTFQAFKYLIKRLTQPPPQLLILFCESFLQSFVPSLSFFHVRVVNCSTNLHFLIAHLVANSILGQHWSICLALQYERRRDGKATEGYRGVD